MALQAAKSEMFCWDLYFSTSKNWDFRSLEIEAVFEIILENCWFLWFAFQVWNKYISMHVNQWVLGYDWKWHTWFFQITNMVLNLKRLTNCFDFHFFSRNFSPMTFSFFRIKYYVKKESSKPNIFLTSKKIKKKYANLKKSKEVLNADH